MALDLRFRDGAGVSADGSPLGITMAAAVVDTGRVATHDLGEITQAVQLTGAESVTADLGSVPAASYDLALDLLVSSERTATPAGLLGGDATPVVIRAVPGAGDGWAAEAIVRSGSGVLVTVRTGQLAQQPGTFVLLTLAVLGSEVALLVDDVVVDRRRRSGFTLAAPTGQTVLVGALAAGFVGQVAAVRIRAVVSASVEALVTAAIDDGLAAIASVWDERQSELGAAAGAEGQYGAVRSQRFDRGSVYWSPGTGAHAVFGPIRDRYDALGAAIGRLGLPVAEEAALSDVLRTPKGRVGRGLRLLDMVVEKVPRRRLRPDEVLDLGPSPAFDPEVNIARRALPRRLRKGFAFEQLSPHQLHAQEVGKRLGVPVGELLAERAGNVQVFRNELKKGRARWDDAVVLAPDQFLAAEPLAQTLQGLHHEGTSVGDLDPELTISLQELLSTAGHVDKMVRIVDREGIGYVIRAPRAQRFERGIIVWSAAEGARELYSTIATYWMAMGGSDGFLGVPLTGESPVGDGAKVRFVGATVYSSARTGTHEVHGDILVKYEALGGPAGMLGFPVTDEQDLEGAPGARVSAFEHGQVLWSGATGARILFGAIGDFYRANGGAAKYGLPVSDETTIGGGEREIRFNDLERGLIAWNQHLGVFDTFELRLLRVTSGEISDGYEPPFGENTEAELYTRSWVTVDGTEVRNVRAPAEGHVGRNVNLPSDPLLIPLRRNLLVEVRIKAWDWDDVEDDDLAEHKHSFTLDDAFFGYVSTGGSYPDVASTWDGRDASADAIKFSYEFGPHFPLDLTKFRQYLWWPFKNFETAELGWDEYADTFDDVDPDKDLLGEIGDALGLDYFSREYAEVAKGGNCFGMSLLAAETFNHRSGYAEPLSDDMQDPQTSRAINLRQGVQKGLAYMMYRLASAALPGAFDPRNLWAQVGTITGQGTPVLVSMKGKDGEKSAGHAVLAYRCTAEGAEKWIWVADPNLPYGSDPDDSHSTIRIRADGSYTVQFSGTSYDGKDDRPSFNAGAYSSGSRGDRYLTWTPFGAVTPPHTTPSLGMELACAGLNLVVSSTCDGGEVHQIGTASGEHFFADRRREVWGKLHADRERLGAAAAVLGESAHQQGARVNEPLARAREALSAITLLGGGSDILRLSDTIAVLPSELLEPARESWGGIGGLELATEISEADLDRPIISIGRYITPEAWPNLVEVPIEGSGGGQLFVMSGRVPKDLFVQMSSGRAYDLRAYAAGSGARVSSPAGAAGTDTIRLDRFASERPGVRVSSPLTDQRMVEITLSRAVGLIGREDVGWKVILDLAAEGESELTWAVGRIGARLTRPGDAPAVSATWSGGRAGSKRTVTYQLPATLAAEQLRLRPADLASPFGTLQVDRLATSDGRLLERLELPPQ